jgi:hypothetical protein
MEPNGEQHGLIDRRSFLKGAVGALVGVFAHNPIAGVSGQFAAGVDENRDARSVEQKQQQEQEHQTTFDDFRAELDHLVEPVVETWEEAVDIYSKSISTLQDTASMPANVSATFIREVSHDGETSLVRFRYYPDGPELSPTLDDSPEFRNDMLEIEEPDKIKSFGVLIDSVPVSVTLPEDFGDGLDFVPSLFAGGSDQMVASSEVIHARVEDDAAPVVTNSFNYRIANASGSLVWGVTYRHGEDGVSVEHNYTASDSNGKIIGSSDTALFPDQEVDQELAGQVMVKMHEQIAPVLQQANSRG